jgi:hypothetical protein
MDTEQRGEKNSAELKCDPLRVPPRSFRGLPGSFVCVAGAVDIIRSMKSFAQLATIALAVQVVVALAASARTAGQDKAVDVTGKWALTVETGGGSGTPTVELKQDGETLTGTYSSRVFGDQKVTGKIKGSAITFSFTASFQGNSATVTYDGTADATTMKGKVTVGDMGEGTFTGKKQ